MSDSIERIANLESSIKHLEQKIDLHIEYFHRHDEKEMEKYDEITKELRIISIRLAKHSVIIGGVLFISGAIVSAFVGMIFTS